MSMHKLTAGSGYDYLTRQVAAVRSCKVSGSNSKACAATPDSAISCASVLLVMRSHSG